MSTRKVRHAENFVNTSFRVPASVTGTAREPGLAELVADELTRKLSHVTGRQFLRGEAVALALRHYLAEIDKPGFEKRFLKAQMEALDED